MAAATLGLSALLLAFNLVRFLGAAYLLHLGIRTYALLSGTLHGWLSRSARLQRSQRYLAGGVYTPSA